MESYTTVETQHANLTTLRKTGQNQRTLSVSMGLTLQRDEAADLHPA